MLYLRVIQCFLRFYRYFISPALHGVAGPGMGCKFSPTCSEYASQAVGSHGVWRGGWLALRRISRCHPFSRAPHHDPVISPSGK